jgi:hypothetical protein
MLSPDNPFGLAHALHALFSILYKENNAPFFLKYYIP